MRNSTAFLTEFAEGLGLVKGILGGTAGANFTADRLKGLRLAYVIFLRLVLCS